MRRLMQVEVDPERLNKPGFDFGTADRAKGLYEPSG
jgi:hypothetical protein